MGPTRGRDQREGASRPQPRSGGAGLRTPAAPSAPWAWPSPGTAPSPLTLPALIGNRAFCEQLSADSPLRGVQRHAASRLYLQRKMSIIGEGSWGNLPLFRKTELYTKVRSELSSYKQELVDFHLSQMFSTDEDFENWNHFIQVITYDVQNKSGRDAEHNIQERFMTRYGWRARALAKNETQSEPTNRGKSKVGPGSKQQTPPPSTKKEGGDEKPPLLKVYRTMSVAEWASVSKDDASALGAHLGDFKQSLQYLHRKSDPKVLIEFTLNPGAELSLFSAGTLALPAEKSAAATVNNVRTALGKEGRGGSFAVATVGEGKASNAIGLKAEEHGDAGFSLVIGGGTSSSKFLALVKRRRILGYSNGKQVVGEVLVPSGVTEEADDGIDLAEVASGEATKSIATTKAPSSGSDTDKGKQKDTDSGKAPLKSSKGAEKDKDAPPEMEDTEEWAAFIAALQDVPIVEEEHNDRVEPHNPANQYVGQGESSTKSGSVAKAKRYESGSFTVTPNAGGGDCLFHALHGSDMLRQQMIVLRKQVAAVRNGMNSNQVLNATNAAAALYQTREDLGDLVTGRHNIPDIVYALLQSVPGMYAGEDELIQWCILKQKVVVVVDPGAPLEGGGLAIFRPTGRQVVPVNEANMIDRLSQMARRASMVLLKSPGHWERITRLPS